MHRTVWTFAAHAGRHALWRLTSMAAAGAVTTRVLGAGVRPGARVALVRDGLVPVFAAEAMRDDAAARG